MLSASEGMSAFSNVGIGYLEIAFDAQPFKLPIDKVNVLFRDSIIYTHGLACFIVSGLIKATKAEAYAMVRNHMNLYFNPERI